MSIEEKKMFDVGFIVGSTTDLPEVEAAGILKLWNGGSISWVQDVISADRSPWILQDRCVSLIDESGVRVFLGAAGKAARLPNTIAGHSRHQKPVIGVALPSSDFPDGRDGTLSIISAPAGCPVGFAGVGTKGLRNGAIFIKRMLIDRANNQLVSIVVGDEYDLQGIEEAGMIDLLNRCKINWEKLDLHEEKPSIVCERILERQPKICITGLRAVNLLKGHLVFPEDSPLMIGIPLASDGFSTSNQALKVLAKMPKDWPVVSTGLGTAGLKNAALLAAQILIASDVKGAKEIKASLISYYHNNRIEPLLENMKSPIRHEKK